MLKFDLALRMHALSAFYSLLLSMNVVLLCNDILIVDVDGILPELIVNNGSLIGIKEGDNVSICGTIPFAIEPDVEFLLAYAGDFNTGLM